MPTGANTTLQTKAAVLALDALGESKAKIAQALEIGRNTVTALLKNGDHTDPRIVDRVKREMAGRFWVTAARAQEAITDEKLNAASALQLATVAAIGTDKALLLDGKPTARLELVGVKDEEAQRQIAELEAQLEGWKEGTTLNAVGEMVDPDGQAPTT